MRNRLRVAVLGTGRMGSGIIGLLLRKQGVELVGAYGRRPDRAGVDVGEAIGRDGKIGIALAADLPAMLAAAKPEVVIQATCSRVEEAAAEIEAAVAAGANVISIAEEMAYPFHEAPGLSAEIHRLAVANRVTVLGTGINPGFVLDLLVIALTGVCFRVDAITARRVNDLSPYGPSVLRTQGVGITPEAFRKGVADGSVVCHFGFPESIGMIAGALGWRIDRIEQTREAIVSRVRRETPFVKIEPGLTAGCTHTATGYRGDKAVIHLVHPQQVHPQLENVQTGDTIEIRGEPDVRFSGSPEIPGGIGTIALAVNMIPQVVTGPPGVITMADLPVPAALMGDVRQLIAARRRPGKIEQLS